MDAFYEGLIVRAATIDELLSDDFEPSPGQKGDADVAALRLAAWCRSSASGDWSLFSRRLARDGLAFDQVLSKFSAVRRKPSIPPPAWIDDAIWIEAALQSPIKNIKFAREHKEPIAFEHLFTTLIEQADALLRSNIDIRAFERLKESAQAGLRLSLLKALSGLSAPAIYERFAKARTANGTPTDFGTSQYDQFVAEMKGGGFRRLFEDQPVLLRLIATITRQWIDTSREFVLRLDSDLAAIRRDILYSDVDNQVTKIEGELSDPHNSGHSVQIVNFEDGSKVVYKPKDLRLDVAWYSLVNRLNRAEPPLELKAVRAILRPGYGWTEFVDHTGCADQNGFKLFFRRAGAWLALLHCFAATDMHQENMIASGEHPVPIDLETILHAMTAEHKTRDPEMLAFDAACEIVANSVMMVGFLPAYGRSPNNSVFAVGGMTSEWNFKIQLTWKDVNTDAMRPTKTKEVGKTTPNMPYVVDRYAKFGDYIDDFIAGFEGYARFLLHQTRGPRQGGLFDDFSGVPVRTVVRPTRFYYMLLQRLKNHRAMEDGIIWSAQSDFVARLADWEKDSDPTWHLHRAERSALIALNVPHFVSPSDGNVISDETGAAIHTEAISGIDRAQARVQNFDEQDIAWQVTVIRQNMNSLSRFSEAPASTVKIKQALQSAVTTVPTSEIFVREADKIAAELAHYAIRRGPSAAWIGLEWLGDSEVSQLVCLGPELYNGVSGIAVFLAAHTAVTGHKSSGELALAGISHLRKDLRGRNAPRIARSLGVGGAIGMGSVVYALAVISKLLHNDGLLADAHAAAELFTDDLIAADKQLDVIGGSAGAILGLLRLYRDTQSGEVLRRAIKCGEHLLRQPRVGPEGSRSWIGQGFGQLRLNGMSHGAAGFAFALASLSAATGRDEFARAASECISFENSSYDAGRANWPDLRMEGELGWPCQWCHGASGIGLARIAAKKQGQLDTNRLETDIQNALSGAERGWLGQVDTLCCGTLGNIEFFCEAGSTLGRTDLRKLASSRLRAVLENAASTGDYRWNSGSRQFNLGLLRGIAGVGYTSLRQLDGSLPNILIWE